MIEIEHLPTYINVHVGIWWSIILTLQAKSVSKNKNNYDKLHSSYFLFQLKEKGGE